MSAENPTSPYDVGEAVLALVLGTLQPLIDQGELDGIAAAYVGAGVVAWDYCCGQLVVTPEDTFRYLSFPTPATGQDLSCYKGDIGIQLSVLLLRCVPVVDEGGDPPDECELADAHARIHRDAALVWNTLDGPMPNDEWETAGLSQRLLGADGGCVAIETRLTIGLERPDFCVEDA